MLIWSSGLSAMSSILNIINADVEWRKRHGVLLVAGWTFLAISLVGGKPADPLATDVRTVEWGPFKWEERVKPSHPEAKKSDPIVALADAAAYADRMAEMRAMAKALPPPDEQPMQAAAMPVVPAPIRVADSRPVQWNYKQRRFNSAIRYEKSP